MNLIKRYKVRLLFRVNEIANSLNSQQKSTLYTLCKKYVDNYDGENNSDMVTNGEWRFMKLNLGQCKIVFDVGANIGEWTTLALNINNNISVHCFEPNHYAFNKLIKKKFPTSVICNNFGLSSIKGENDLYIFENGSGLNSLYQRHGLENGWNLKPQHKKEKVQLDTLQNYCNEKNISKIDYMKIDVEGHELEVFKGGRDLFTNVRVDIIQFEYGGCNIDSHVLLKDIFDFFKGRDYDFYKIYPDYTKLIKRYDQRLENFQHQNWLIIKKGTIFNK